jgi:sugar phosphate isomerase/epimerase
MIVACLTSWPCERKDCVNINVSNITGFCNPLQGDVPWAKVRAALEAIGYDDYVTAEVDGYHVHPEVGLKHICEALKTVFQS